MHLSFWRLEVQNQALLVFSEASLLALQMVIISLWPQIALPLRAHIPDVAMCIQISSSYKDTSQYGLEPNFNLITSLKTLSSNRVTF